MSVSPVMTNGTSPDLLRQLFPPNSALAQQQQQNVGNLPPLLPFGLNKPLAPLPSLAQLQFLAQLGMARSMPSSTLQQPQASPPAMVLPQPPCATVAEQHNNNNNNHNTNGIMDPNKLLSTLGPLQSVPMATTDFGPSAVSDQNLAQLSLPRKRRRAIGNLDNTLDGLVAKRADQMPGKRRYQTETEAIELPDDEAEIKRMEADPDVCTRMCSICGYQGKWVSEMIRHKRVHTNERPFKCRYCNRTSKWKADLIRHVAKTHGIRVVSKYSRSKAFEMGNRGGGGVAEVAEDDVVVLGGTSFSSASSDSGHSSASAQEDENNNSIRNGQKLHGGDSLNSYMRKAQRLSSIVRNQNNNSNQNQNQNSLDQNNPVLALNLMGSGGSAEVAKQPQQPVTGLSDMQLTLLQFLNLFPQLFPQQNLLQHNQKN